MAMFDTPIIVKKVSAIDRYFLYSNNVKPFEVTTTEANVGYERWFSGGAPGYIRKTIVTETGNSVYYAFDTWANRETATYKPLYGAQ